uniref:Conjugative transposon protein n=1 Tax=Meloidogyne hapla TaxID=6305 RepID=A0A1I8B5A8_MELHA
MLMTLEYAEQIEGIVYPAEFKEIETKEEVEKLSSLFYTHSVDKGKQHVEESSNPKVTEIVEVQNFHDSEFHLEELSFSLVELTILIEMLQRIDKESFANNPYLDLLNNLYGHGMNYILTSVPNYVLVLSSTQIFSKIKSV